jgi:hypothetical protein
MTELLSLNEDETVHCYTCNRDSHLTAISVRSWREVGTSVFAATGCPACGRPAELHLDRGVRAGAAEQRALAVLLGASDAVPDVCAA